MQYYPEVVQAVARPDFHIAVYFSDGRITDFDMGPLINGGGVFSSILDTAIFEKCLTVMNGTAAWDLEGNRDDTKCIDIDPYELYAAKRVADPLEAKPA